MSATRGAGEHPQEGVGEEAGLKPLGQRVEASFTSRAGCQRAIPKQWGEATGLFVSFWSIRFQREGRERKIIGFLPPPPPKSKLTLFYVEEKFFRPSLQGSEEER